MNDETEIPAVNCWEDRQCGRQPGGGLAERDGPCPVALDTSCDSINRGANAGRFCWENRSVHTEWCHPTLAPEEAPGCDGCPVHRRVKYEEGGHYQPFKPGLGTTDVGALHRLLNDTVRLMNVCRDILGHLAVHPLLVHVAQYARAVTDATSASVYLPDDADGTLRLEAHAGPLDRPARVSPDDGSPAAEALRTRSLQLVAYPAGQEGRAASVAAFPIAGDEVPAGVIELAKASGQFSVDDEWFLMEFGMMTGVGLRNARLIESIHQLRDLDKAKSRFVALLMHQIGSPLATIACSLQAISQIGDRLSPEDRDQLMANSLERINTVQSLARRLLDLAAIRSGRHLADIRAVSPLAVLTKEVEAIRPNAERNGVDVKLRAEVEDAEVNADSEGLRVVFSNLLDNAVKYSGGPGQTVAVSLAADESVVRISVSDQGMGIPADEQVRLFEEFHRARNAAVSGVAGHGLGLAFVSELVARYHGRISVNSTVGVGTTFIVEFPVRKVEP